MQLFWHDLSILSSLGVDVPMDLPSSLWELGSLHPNYSPFGQDLIQHLLREGRRGATEYRATIDGAMASSSCRALGFPLMYQWHGELYLGAIHGRLILICELSLPGKDPLGKG